MNEVVKMIIDGWKFVFVGTMVVLLLVVIFAMLVAAYCYIEGLCGVGGNAFNLPRNSKSLDDVFAEYFWKKGEMRRLIRKAMSKK